MCLSAAAAAVAATAVVAAAAIAVAAEEEQQDDGDDDPAAAIAAEAGILVTHGVTSYEDSGLREASFHSMWVVPKCEGLLIPFRCGRCDSLASATCQRSGYPRNTRHPARRSPRW